jgi:hypothetical protein
MGSRDDEVEQRVAKYLDPANSFENRVMGEDEVPAPGGVLVLVRTMRHLDSPYDLSGGCSCHEPGAFFGTAVFWPHDGVPRPIEVAEYHTAEDALEGHREVVRKVRAGEPLQET